MEAAYWRVFKRRSQSLQIIQDSKLLPDVLKPLGKVLAAIGVELSRAYQNFEQSFDSFQILSCAKLLKQGLQILVQQARGLDIMVPRVHLKQRSGGVDQFSAIVFRGGQVGEEEFSKKMGAVELGKRPCSDSPFDQEASRAKLTKVNMWI